MRNRPPFDTLHEECGVFGIYGDLETPPAQAVYYGLYALQHRGQESCGIAVSDQGVLSVHRAMGLVSEVFDEACLPLCQGRPQSATSATPQRAGASCKIANRF